MRLMVPEDLSTLDDSPLFSAEAKRAYAPNSRAPRSSARQRLRNDESVATFVLRHFGPEVLAKSPPRCSPASSAATSTNSRVRAVMPQFVAMEREHG